MRELDVENEGIPAVVRTDFTTNETWQQIKELVTEGAEDDLADLDDEAPEMFVFVDDREYDGATTDELRHAVPDGVYQFVVFAADTTTFSSPERDLVAVHVQTGQTLRLLPELAFLVWNNLLQSNLGFDEMIELATDGIYRR
ncbi:MAG: hypothetical protein INR66_00395 [Gordonia polyisoprenivorans]|nr:hypothetical protein [Gordonia polyisoprenivorans]